MRVAASEPKKNEWRCHREPARHGAVFLIVPTREWLDTLIVFLVPGAHNEKQELNDSTQGSTDITTIG